MKGFNGAYPEHKVNGWKYFDTFEYHGEQYYNNTIVECHDMTLRSALLTIVESHVIDNYGKEWWYYGCWKWPTGYESHITEFPPDKIIKRIIEPATHPPTLQKQEYYKDWEVSNVMIGWGIYIALMFFGMVFRDVITLWVFGTLYFLCWRREHLKKPPNHDWGFNNPYEKVKELEKRGLIK